MAIIRLLYPGAGDLTNFWSAAPTLLSAFSETLRLPPAASANPDRKYVYRSLMQTSGQWLQADLGTTQTVSAIAVADLKTQNAGTVTLQEGGALGTTWNDVLVLPDADPDTKVTFGFFDPTSARFWRLLSVNGNGSVADTFEVGVVHLGGSFEPARSVKRGLAVPVDDPSTVTLSVGRQATATGREQYVAGSFEWDHMTLEDLRSLDALYRAVGIRRPLFVIVDEDLAWTAWYLRLTGPIGRTFEEDTYLYSVTVPWEESL